MKAQVAQIRINDETTLKVMLVPEDEMELEFLKKALDECEGYKVSARFEIDKE